MRSLEKLRIKATCANDWRALSPLLHDDLIYINSVGEVYDKEQYLRAIQSHSLTYEKDFYVEETECRVFDGLIMLVGIMLGHSRLDGEQQAFNYRCLSVWREQSGEWAMVAWQSSSSNRGF